MKKLNKGFALRVAGLLSFAMTLGYGAFARFGGAGGSHGGGGGYSGGGGGFGGGGYIGGGGGLGPGGLIVVIIIIVIVMYIQRQQKQGAGPQMQADVPPAAPFPPGLTADKVGTSFLAIQDAWQRKDLTDVRKWLSDGMYQRISTQFKMMDALGQRNDLSDIRIYNIQPVRTRTDGQYFIADVAVSFSMNDEFTSNKYPQFNESYPADEDTEYWTFIKRTDSPAEKNLYDNNNCPNCGAPFEVKMGEISRCSNCNTLTNSAAYDWVLSEVIQGDDYSLNTGLAEDANLKALMQADPFFAVQRMEDIASNIFMQVMEVFTLGDYKRLSHFASDELADIIEQQQKTAPKYLFDRLFINDTVLNNYTVEEDTVKLYFNVKVTYRRVSVAGRLQLLDEDFATHVCTMELSRSKNPVKKNAETVYSYECNSCGAPFTDTTEANCSYCGAPIIDKNRDWVLTGFSWKY